MNIEELRDYCLAMNDVTEKTPFGKFSPRFDSTLVFYVLGHMFCMIDMNNFDSVCFRSTPEEIDRIRSHHLAVHKPINPALKFWIRVDLNKDISDKEVYSYIRRAYEIVRIKYTRKNKNN